MGTVALDHIVKTYNKGSLIAVNDVSLKVNEGELFGLIGPDGVITRLDSRKARIGAFDASHNGCNPGRQR